MPHPQQITHFLHNPFTILHPNFYTHTPNERLALCWIYSIPIGCVSCDQGGSRARRAQTKLRVKTQHCPTSITFLFHLGGINMYKLNRTQLLYTGHHFPSHRTPTDPGLGDHLIGGILALLPHLFEPDLAELKSPGEPPGRYAKPHDMSVFEPIRYIERERDFTRAP